MVDALYQRFPMLGRARAQVWLYSPKFRRPRHFHAEQELNLIVAGAATFGVGDAVVEVHAGDLLGFPPGQDHVLLRASPDLVLFAIGMTPELSLEVLRGEPYATAAPFRVSLPRTALGALVKRSAEVAQRDGVDPQIAELWEAAQRARTSGASSSGSAPHVLTRRTLANILSGPELSRAALARLSRAHQSEISRHFHRDAGVTLVRYRTRTRLLRFIQLVDFGGGNLTAAALEAGFGSYSQCHRSFHAELGCSPRSFFLTDLRRRMEDAFEPMIDGGPAQPFKS